MRVFGYDVTLVCNRVKHYSIITAEIYHYHYIHSDEKEREREREKESIEWQMRCFGYYLGICWHMSARAHAHIYIYVRTFVIVKMYCTSGQRFHAVSPTLSIVFPIRFAIANNSAIFYIKKSLLNRESAKVIKILNIQINIAL